METTVKVFRQILSVMIVLAVVGSFVWQMSLGLCPVP